MSQNERDLSRRDDDAKAERGEPRSDHPDNAAIAREAAAIYPDTNAGPPTPEEVAAEAYRIYLGRGAEHGRDIEDWLEAQRRLVGANRSSGP